VHRSILLIALSIRLTAADLDTARQTGFSQVPIRLAHGFAPVAPVWVGGEGPFDFLIDTGTNTVLIDPDLAKRFPSRAQSAMMLDSLNGSTRVSAMTLPSLRIGEETVSHVEAIVNNLDGVHRLSARIRGVIGINILRQFSFEIDYEKSRLALWKPGTLPPPVIGAVIPAVTEGDRIVVPFFSAAARNGHWNLALDSGIRQPLIFREQLMPAARDDGATSLLSTNAAQTSARTLHLEELQGAGVRWSNVTALSIAGQTSPQNGLEDGLFPACAFAAVRFELAAEHMVLVPRGLITSSACSP